MSVGVFGSGPIDRIRGRDQRSMNTPTKGPSRAKQVT